MGRSKKKKPRSKTRPPRRTDEPAEWFATAFHEELGMCHLDIRPSGNGVLITASPAEFNGSPAFWQVRLRNEDEGQGLRDLGTAFAAGRAHALGAQGPDGGTCLVFIPHHPDEGVGTFALVQSPDGPEADVHVERSAQRPMEMWAQAGENLLRIVSLLDPVGSMAPEVEDCLPCPGCGRPVYDSSASYILMGPMPLFGLCRLCAEGTTLRLLRESGVPVPPQQRVVLESAAAVLA